MWHKCGSIWSPTRAPNEFQAFFLNTENDTLEASIPAGGTWGDVIWGPGNTGNVTY